MKHAPSHPRFQAAARFHIVRLICLGCSETKTFFFKGCLFSKDCPSSQQIFFSKTLCFYLLSFFKDSPSFQQVFFSKIFFTCQSFFQRLSICSAICLFLKDFFLNCLFFSKLLFWQRTDRATLVEPLERFWLDNLCCSVCPLPKSILEYLAVFLFSKTIFFSKGPP